MDGLSVEPDRGHDGPVSRNLGSSAIPSSLHQTAPSAVRPAVPAAGGDPARLARPAAVGRRADRRGLGGRRRAAAGRGRRLRGGLGRGPRHGRGRHRHRRGPGGPAGAVRRGGRPRPLLRRRRGRPGRPRSCCAGSAPASCCRARRSGRPATRGCSSCPWPSTRSRSRRRWRPARSSTSTCCLRVAAGAPARCAPVLTGVTVVAAPSLDEGFAASGQAPAGARRSASDDASRYFEAYGGVDDPVVTVVRRG